MLLSAQSFNQTSQSKQRKNYYDRVILQKLRYGKPEIGKKIYHVNQ